MISVDEALDRVLSFINALEEERKPLLECLGQVLAEDIYSSSAVPPYDNSAMDGYAVQAESIKGASPKQPRVLRVIGEVAGGSVTEQEVVSGTAIRIMTGAPIPKGADTVVPFEETDEVERKQGLAPGTRLTEIGIRYPVAKGANIRRAGEDIAKGSLVLERGRVLRPAEIGVLASLGIGMISVIRRPLVAILATGDEVLDIDQTLLPGKIYNSNSYSLAAQVLRYGGIPKLLGIAPDSIEPLMQALYRGLDCDILVTSGGVSLGDYDIVKDTLEKEGEISFWTVRMKPGKPFAFGIFKGKTGQRIPHFGLPGNPVSVMIAFELFIRPTLLKMMGKKDLVKPTIKAIMESPIKNTDGRRIFARVIVTKQEDKYFARLTGPQGAGILTSMAQANGLAIIPEVVEVVDKGDIVEVMMLDWNETQV